MVAHIIGTLRPFEYHCYEGKDSQDYILFQHTHQPALILRELGPDEVDIEEVGRIFEVCFADGLRWEVFADELGIKSPMLGI